MDYAQQQRNPAKHLIGFTVVVVLHVIVVYALVNGLARKVVDVIKGPIETKLVKETKEPPPPEAPPPPPPKLVVPPPPFIPPPEIQIAVAVSPNAISAVTNKTPPPAPPPMKPTPRPGTPAALARDTCPTVEPPYPMASKRNQETGTLVLRLQIGPDGTASAVEVTKSSGHARLDESAKNWIVTCHFKPATADGKPIASTLSQSYTFNLRD